MIGKIIGAVCLILVMVFRADAQELGIEGDGGLQGMQYQLKGGQSKLLPGGSFGVNYTFALGSQWGLVTGITGGLYRTQATLQDGQFAYGQVDQVGSAFEYHLRTTGYKEVQHFFAASIPLLLQYHTDGAGAQWYIDAGGKVFVPWGTGIAVSARQLSLSGYYPDLNLEVSNLPQHGFGTINNWKSSASFSLKPAAAVSGGTGVSFALAPGRRLYVGIYVDLGVTSLKDKRDSMPLLTYSPTGVGGAKASGVLNMPNAGKATLFAVGLQVRLSFGGAKGKPRVHHQVDSAVVGGPQFEVHVETVPATPQSVTPKPVASHPGTPQSVAPKPVASHPATPQSVTQQQILQLAAPPDTLSPAKSVIQQAPQATPPPPPPQATTLQSTTKPTTTPKPPPAPAPAKPVTKPSSLSDDEFDIIQAPVVFGVVGGTLIPELQRQHLDQVADIMKLHPDIHLSIVGHFCNSGMETESAKVGLARAVAIQRYLESKGISRKSKRIEVSAATESDQEELGDPAANYWKRRVEIRVQ